jgi:hypothetical protein
VVRVRVCLALRVARRIALTSLRLALIGSLDPICGGKNAGLMRRGTWSVSSVGLARRNRPDKTMRVAYSILTSSADYNLDIALTCFIGKINPAAIRTFPQER